MRKTHIALLSIMLVCISMTGFAKLYSDPPAFQGTLLVGPGGDYPNLKTAADDLNTTPLTGNVILEITGDFNEPQNFGLAAVTGAFSVTIKPAAATQPTITFTDTSDNPGFSGGFIIGCNQITDLNIGIIQGNYVIDGSNNGTNSRDLTFLYPSTFSVHLDPLSTGGGGFPVGINVVGIDGVVLKNFNLDFLVDSANFSTAARSCYAIRLSTRQSTVGPTSWLPDNTLLQNLNIYAVGARQAHGVGATSSGTISAVQKAMYGTVIEDCIIEGQTRGILFNNNADFIVRRNYLRATQNDPVGGLVGTGFVHASSNADPTLWVSYIEDNIFDKTYSAATAAGGGISGIQLTGAPAAAGRTYVVRNNVWKNFTLTASTSIDLVYRGIETGSSFSQMQIYNNTILMPLIPNVSGVTNNRSAAISATATSSAAGAHNFILKNNIINYQQTTGTSCVVYKRNGDAVALIPTSNKNDFITPFTTSGSFARVGATPTTLTYAAWQAQTGTPDVASITLDPTSLMDADGFHWLAASDSSPYAIGDTGGNIPTDDIDGITRSVSPIVGATEGFGGSPRLSVASAFGSPDPAVGNHWTAFGTWIEAIVDATVSTGVGIRQANTGYTGTGSIGSGAGNTVQFTLSTTSTLTWNWQLQNQITTAASPVAGGTVTPATGSWYNDGTIVPVQATANGGWFFLGWSGDLTGTTNPDNVTMDAPKSVTALFTDRDISTTTTCGYMDWGIVANSTTSTLCITLNNAGTEPLTVTGAAISGANAANFSVHPSTSFPIVIPGGGSSSTLCVVFAPNAVQSYVASLDITSDDPDEVLTQVCLTGDGVGAPLTVPDWVQHK